MKPTFVLMPLLVLLIFLLYTSCEESSSSSSKSGNSGDSGSPTATPESEKASSEEISEAAVTLPDFPTDAEVTEPESFDVNGSKVTGTDNVQLDDTDADSSHVDVTLPSSLSRASTIESVFLWINGTTEELDFFIEGESLYVSGTVPLQSGENYFLIFAKTEDGREFRTPIIKVNRVENDGVTENNGLVGSWRVVKEYFYETGNEVEELNGQLNDIDTYPIKIEGTNETYQFYYEITETTIQEITLHRTYNEDGSYTEVLIQCSSSIGSYVMEGDTLIETGSDGEVSTSTITLSGDVYTLVDSDGSFKAVYYRDTTYDLSSATDDCSYDVESKK